MLAAWCWRSLALAQTGAARDITLVEGRGELLQFQRDVQKVALAEPKIADAVVLSPREVMVNAKTPGHTTLLIWETGSDPARYEIEVAKDNSDWDSFRKLIEDNANGGAVTVTGSGDTIVLAGSVKSADDSKRLAGMAQTRAKTVINLLKAPPPPDPRQILLQVKFAAVDRTALTQVGFNLFSLNGKMIGGTGTEQFTPPRFTAISSATPDQQHGQFFRSPESVRVPARSQHRRHHQGARGARPASDSG